MAYPEFLHPEIETRTTAAHRAVQDQKWAAQWDYVRQRSDFYRAKLPGKIGAALDLDALQDLPLTDKDELRRSQEADGPYGTYIACRKDKVIRIHRTSGTTGRALILANSQRDIDIITAQGGRSMYCAGLRPGDRVVHCLNYQLWTGGVTDHMTLEAAGATTIPFGTGSTERLVEVIRDLGANAISCTPSYPALLEKAMRGEMGLDPRELKLRIALFGGEAALDSPAFRERLEAAWGFKARNANFGLSEVMSNFASQCDHTHDLHFHAADVLFPEILDPVSGQRLPIEEGTTGEIVYTHLEKECQPLIRYSSRDVITVTGTGPCRCGRTAWRFRVTGRTDDMFNVRGVNVFPTAIQRIVTADASLTSGHFRIRLAGPGPYDRIVLRLEAASTLAEADWPGVAAAVAARIRSQIGATAEVQMIAFESLPRTDGKTALIERT